MSKVIRIAVVPAAGLGTRILPATKVLPKELLPIVDRPIIQYGVTEAVASGIKQIVLVISPDNTLTAAHFAPKPELEAVLEARGKTGMLSIVNELSRMAEVKTVHQIQPLGLGHAVLAAKLEVGNEPFAVVLPDDVIDSDPPILRRMIETFNKCSGPILLVERVPTETIHQYGIIEPSYAQDGVIEVRDLIEKPSPDQAPSNLAIVGRYIFTPDVFTALEQTDKDASGEIQLTDGLRRLLGKRPLYACELTGIRHDAGTKIGFLKASIHFALKDPALAQALRDYLRTLD